MLRYFCPNLFVDRVVDINLSALQAKGFDTLILDLDNTLVGWRASAVPPQVSEWLGKARDMGFKMCIVSNCILRGRVNKFAQLLDLPAISKAIKPRKRAFVAALKLLDATAASAVVIGDQMFTDILGGNRLGVYTIMVLPVDRREFFSTIIQRTAEKIILFRLRRSGMLNDRRTPRPRRGSRRPEGGQANA